MDTNEKPVPQQRLLTITSRRATLTTDRNLRHFVSGSKDPSNKNIVTVLPTNSSSKGLLMANPSSAGPISMRAKPQPHHITVDKSTLTPIISTGHQMKMVLPTTINNTITITAKMPNGTRSIVNGTSILSTVVAAAAAKPQPLPILKPSSIPPCTTLTRISNIAHSTVPLRTAPTTISNDNHTALPHKKDLVLMPPDISVVESTKSSFSFYTPHSTTATTTSGGGAQTSLPAELIHLTSYMAKQNTNHVNILPTTQNATHQNIVIAANSETNVFALVPQHFSITQSVQVVPATKPTTSIERPIVFTSSTAPDVVQPSTSKNMTNVQITNGVLSDRKGPIGMLTGNTSVPKSNGANGLTIMPTTQRNADLVTMAATAEYSSAKTAENAGVPWKASNPILIRSKRMQNRAQSCFQSSTAQKLESQRLKNHPVGQAFGATDSTKAKVFLALAPKHPLSTQPRSQSIRMPSPPVLMAKPSRIPTPPVPIDKPPASPLFLDKHNGAPSSSSFVFSAKPTTSEQQAKPTPPEQQAKSTPPTNAPPLSVRTKTPPALFAKPNIGINPAGHIDESKQSAQKPIVDQQINIDKTDLSNICVSLFESLECPEQMDDKSSTKSKSVTPEKPVEQSTEQKATNVAALAVVENAEQPPGSVGVQAKTQRILDTVPLTWRPTKRGFKYNDAMKHIKWNKGIGYLPNSDLNFGTNEFHMVEQTPRNPINPINHMFAKSVHDGAFIHIRKRQHEHSNMENIGLPSTSNPFSNGGPPNHKRSQQTLLKSLARQRAQSNASGGAPNHNNGGGGGTNDGGGGGGQMITIPVQGGPFSWDIYLEHMAAKAAPVDLFYNPFPCAPNSFEVGMKLECIDPQNCARFCVATIVQIAGYRLRLRFDGQGAEFIFWCNADSQDIFPAGWCQRTGRKLMAPPNIPYGTAFDWQTYLASTNSRPAPRTYFTHLNSTTTGNAFKAGMKLEAEDLRNSRKMCVASVADVLDNRVLIHFDGWNEKYDYWTDINSPYIHPVNWHMQNGFNITGPPNHVSPFCWKMYLAATKTVAAPASAFAARAPMGFEIGMKLEIVDKKNPTLIRPATILNVVEYEIRVLFDGWPDEYAYWMDDDHPDLHPIRWCERTGHPLEITPKAPKYARMHNCCIPSCRGIGNVKNILTGIHLKADECPYSLVNWKSEDAPNRLDEYYEILERKKQLACESLKTSSRPHESMRELQQQQQMHHREPTEIKRVKYEPAVRLEFTSPEQLISLSPPPAPVPVIIEVEPTIKLEVLSENSNDGDIEPKPPCDAPTTTTPPPHEETIDRTPLSTVSEETKHSLLPSTKHILEDYMPTLRGTYYLWRHHSKNLFRHLPNGIESIRDHNPFTWTIEDVEKHVGELPGCAAAATRLAENGIDGHALLMLSQTDLVGVLKLRTGPAVKLANYIAILREEVNTRWYVR